VYGYSIHSLSMTGMYKKYIFLIQNSHSSAFTGLEVLKNESELSWRPPFGLISMYAMCAIVKGCTLTPRSKVRSKKASAEGRKRGIDVVAFSEADLKGETYKGLRLADLRNPEINFGKESLCLT
jgi:hypothetical protein